ncbi:MAG: pyruvate kinase, partial [Bacteroidota bacterium]
MTWEQPNQPWSICVDVFRLNFSHGEHESKLAIIQHITRINEEFGVHISILADLQGPKLRVGKIENDGIDVVPGQILTFTNTKCIGNADRIYMSYEQFAQDVSPGERVLVDDGNLVFQVIETNGVDEVKLEVIYGGPL